jgi:hypothetical protein
MGDLKRKSLAARKFKDEKMEDLGKIQMNRKAISLSKKSFSCLLKECSKSRNF